MKKLNGKVAKKIAVMALTGVAAFSVMGCGQTTETAPEEPTEEIAEVGDVIEVKAKSADFINTVMSGIDVSVCPT